MFFSRLTAVIFSPFFFFKARNLTAKPSRCRSPPGGQSSRHEAEAPAAAAPVPVVVAVEVAGAEVEVRHKIQN